MSTPNFLNWHNVAVVSEVDPGMVVEVVEAVLMAEDEVAAEVVGKSSLKSWNSRIFLHSAAQVRIPGLWSLRKRRKLPIVI